MNITYYVYILKSRRDARFYTGFTVDINNRLREHNNGDTSTRSTMNRGPFDLMHVEIVENLMEAIALEKYFKSGSGREVRNEILDYIWWL